MGDRGTHSVEPREAYRRARALHPRSCKVRCGECRVCADSDQRCNALTKPVEPTVLKEALPRIDLGISEEAEELMDS
jgi:hypothetical protein